MSYPQPSGDVVQLNLSSQAGFSKDRAAEYCAFLPNVLFGVQEDHAFAIVHLPTGQKTSVEHIALYFVNQQMLTEDYAFMRVKYATM